MKNTTNMLSAKLVKRVVKVKGYKLLFFNQETFCFQQEKNMSQFMKTFSALFITFQKKSDGFTSKLFLMPKSISLEGKHTYKLKISIK